MSKSRDSSAESAPADDLTNNQVKATTQPCARTRHGSCQRHGRVAGLAARGLRGQHAGQRQVDLRGQAPGLQRRRVVRPARARRAVASAAR